MTLICDNCGKTFTRTRDYQRHMKRTNPCRKPSDLECDRCGKVFDRHAGLVAHKNRQTPCQSKDDIIKELQHQLEVEKLRRELAEIQNKSSTVNSNNTMVQGDENTIVQGDQINIHVEVRNFGDENLEHIIGNMPLMRSCFDKKCNGPRRLMNEIYFNPDHPENHCIRIADISRNKFLIKENDQWRCYTDSKEVAHKTYSGVNKAARKSLKYLDDNGIPIDPKFVDTYNSNKFVYFGKDDVLELEKSLVESCTKNKKMSITDA